MEPDVFIVDVGRGATKKSAGWKFRAQKAEGASQAGMAEQSRTG